MPQSRAPVITTIVMALLGAVCGGIAGRFVVGEWEAPGFIAGGVVGLIGGFGMMGRWNQ